jgi:hypothetical protein
MPLTEKKVRMRHIRVLMCVMLFSMSCSDTGTGPGDRRFNVSLKYGVDARNELNTFNDTFTKDLVLDGTVRTRLVLTEAEIDSIEAMFLSIDIFDYPDTFVAPNSDTVAVVTPHVTYVLKLKRDASQKVVYWADSLVSTDIRGANLRRAFEFTRTLIEAKQEYKNLPPARGGYL